MSLKVPKSHRRGATVSHRHADKQERRTASKLGGVVVRGSGSGPERGDVRIKGIARIENKCTMRKSFSLTRDIVDKIETAALASGEVPAIGIDFLRPDGSVEHSLCVVPAYVLEMLVGGIRDATEKP